MASSAAESPYLPLEALPARGPAPVHDAGYDAGAAESIPGGELLVSRVVRARIVPDEFFGHQPTPTAELPDPRPLLGNLARCVVEVLAGARDLEQIARWVTDDVYRHLLRRVVLSTRSRRTRGVAPVRPSFTLGTMRICEPRDGIVEAVVVVRGRSRARAVAIRLEGLDRRWRASAINVL